MQGEIFGCDAGMIARAIKIGSGPAAGDASQVRELDAVASLALRSAFHVEDLIPSAETSPLQN
jgi:hypothetical protein